MKAGNTNICLLRKGAGSQPSVHANGLRRARSMCRNCDSYRVAHSAYFRFCCKLPFDRDVPGAWRRSAILTVCGPHHMTLKAATVRNSCSFLEISNLRIERAFEGGPRGAAVDVRCQTPVAGDDVGVLEDAQDRRHH